MARTAQLRSTPQRHSTHQSGFTLVELLIVVAIIGILSAVAVPAYQNHTKTSEANVAINTASSLLTNIDLYILEHDQFPTSLTVADIGATQNMSSLGTMALTPEENSLFGTLTFTFNANATLQNSIITFTKSADGWLCTQNTELTLKTCAQTSTAAEGS